MAYRLGWRGVVPRGCLEAFPAYCRENSEQLSGAVGIRGGWAATAGRSVSATGAERQRVERLMPRPLGTQRFVMEGKIARARLKGDSPEGCPWPGIHGVMRR